jgi:hypothetical protein
MRAHARDNPGKDAGKLHTVAAPCEHLQAQRQALPCKEQGAAYRGLQLQQVLDVDAIEVQVRPVVGQALALQVHQRQRRSWFWPWPAELYMRVSCVCSDLLPHVLALCVARFLMFLLLPYTPIHKRGWATGQRRAAPHLPLALPLQSMERQSTRTTSA